MNVGETFFLSHGESARRANSLSKNCTRIGPATGGYWWRFDFPNGGLINPPAEWAQFWPRADFIFALPEYS